MRKFLHFTCDKKTDHKKCPHWKVKNKEDKLRDQLQVLKMKLRMKHG
jgi:hypothetical protein